MINRKIIAGLLSTIISFNLLSTNVYANNMDKQDEKRYELLNNINIQTENKNQKSYKTDGKVQVSKMFQVKENQIPLPLYNQKEYDTPYGGYGTVSTHGCGITCLAMVATYLCQDETLTPDVLAEKYGRYNTEGGSSWGLFPDAAKDLKIGPTKQVFGMGDVVEALKSGHPVISCQGPGLFTGGGHYILLAGLNENDKVIVHDPYGGNYNATALYEGFKTGFEPKQIGWSATSFWIFPSLKEIQTKIPEKRNIEDYNRYYTNSNHTKITFIKA